MSIVLKSVTATCRFCDHKVHQISATEESAHAMEVVTRGMARHMAEAHPDALAQCLQDGEELRG